MSHTNVLAVLYFVTGYFATCTLLFGNSLHLQACGGFLLIYLTFQLVEQLEQ